MDRRWGEDGKDWLGTSRSRISRPCCVSSSPNTTSQSWSGRYRIFSHWFLRTQQVNGKGNFLEAMISLFCKWFGFLMYLLPLFSEYVIAFPFIQNIGAHSAFFSLFLSLFIFLDFTSSRIHWHFSLFLHLALILQPCRKFSTLRLMRLSVGIITKHCCWHLLPTFLTD